MEFWTWLTADPTCRAAFITIVGGALGVAGNLWLNRKQHREAQLLELRRDVYLSCCELNLRMMQSLMNLGSSEYPVAKTLETMDQLSGATAKMHVIAEQATLAALMTLGRAMLQEFGSLTGKKIVIEGNVHELNAIRVQLDGLNDQLRDLQQTMQMLGREFTAATDPTAHSFRLGDAHARLSAASNLSEQFQRRQAALVEQNEKLHTSIIEIAGNLPDRLGPHIAELNLAVRDEIGLEIDQHWYRNRTKENIAAGGTISQQILKEVKDAIAERDAKS